MTGGYTDSVAGRGVAWPCAETARAERTFRRPRKAKLSNMTVEDASGTVFLAGMSESTRLKDCGTPAALINVPALGMVTTLGILAGSFRRLFWSLAQVNV